QSFKNVEIAITAGGLEIREVLDDRVAHLLAAEPVHRRVREDALKQQWQLGRWAISVLLGQPDHRVLHDVEGGVFVAYRIKGALEGALVDALQEVGKFFV